MSTPSDPGQPQHGPVLEPVRVLRPRRTDALAELLKDLPLPPGVGGRDITPGGYDTVALPDPPPGSEAATQELPPVATGAGRPARAPDRTAGNRSGPRRAAVAVAVAAAAVIGFGGALLLPGRADDKGDKAAPAPPPSAAAPADPAPTGPADPDGAGTLREGDTGPEVTALQERLLRVPNVYDNGSTSGRYDAVLTDAVARFQLWYGVRGDETGVYGNDTRAALESHTTPGTG
ncbi:peptidoglycan-binding protein [Streptomyces sp. TRM68367]|uniref:peptidoglycan-binding protein n=1 Tax=Streptomyces sp. TRM68367 TaxID=2758415 RepID=UPI00165A8912|nr:peptidoglycan-binding domain-containing protein [Streptomyces sp. TRM68367]MBC9724793.1 peptidoglycan-binding protein [Streptomyces sp. TRM68367]